MSHRPAERPDLIREVADILVLGIWLDLAPFDLLQAEVAPVNEPWFCDMIEELQRLDYVESSDDEAGFRLTPAGRRRFTALQQAKSS